jgi:hypothetical protein
VLWVIFCSNILQHCCCNWRALLGLAPILLFRVFFRQVDYYKILNEGESNRRCYEEDGKIVLVTENDAKSNKHKVIILSLMFLFLLIFSRLFDWDEPIMPWRRGLASINHLLAQGHSPLSLCFCLAHIVVAFWYVCIVIIQTIRAIYTNQQNLVRRHKICRSTKIGAFRFFSSDMFCVVRPNFAVSCK